MSLKPSRQGRPAGAPTRVIDATSRCIRHAEQRIAVHRPERGGLDRRDVADRDHGIAVDQLARTAPRRARRRRAGSRRPAARTTGRCASAPRSSGGNSENERSSHSP